jgi:Clp amino terminal domain, pathogenicity island component
MFNLDHAITEWRRKMISAGIKSSAVLDELENHLREDVEQQMRSGTAGEQAFRAAVQRVGAAENLNREFAKVSCPAARLSHNTLRACCFVVAAFVFAVETWTLLIYDVTIPERVFGLGMVALIARFIGALPDLNRLLWPGLRGWALRKTITTVCNCIAVGWVGLLFLSLGHIDPLRLGIVASTVCWGLIAAATMTVVVFICGTEPEALNLWTPAVWQSFELAGAEAIRFHHDFIGTEHVLLGLMGEENGTVPKILENLGVRRDTVRAEIEKIIATGPQSSTTRPVVYTPRAKKSFQIAIREAKAARAVRAETEHILLGLVCEGGGFAAQVLKKLGVNATKVREQLRSTNRKDGHA